MRVSTACIAIASALTTTLAAPAKGSSSAENVPRTVHMRADSPGSFTILFNKDPHIPRANPSSFWVTTPTTTGFELGPDCGIAWSGGKNWWNYTLPGLDHPLQVHLGNYCSALPAYSGYTCDNCWVQYEEQFLNVPEDCDVHDGANDVLGRVREAICTLKL